MQFIFWVVAAVAIKYSTAGCDVVNQVIRVYSRAPEMSRSSAGFAEGRNIESAIAASSYEGISVFQGNQLLNVFKYTL